MMKWTNHKPHNRYGEGMMGGRGREGIGIEGKGGVREGMREKRREVGW